MRHEPMVAPTTLIRHPLKLRSMLNSQSDSIDELVKSNTLCYSISNHKGKSSQPMNIFASTEIQPPRIRGSKGDLSVHNAGSTPPYKLSNRPWIKSNDFFFAIYPKRVVGYAIRWRSPLPKE